MARTQTLVTATEWGVATQSACALFSTPGVHSDVELRSVTLRVSRLDDEPNEFGGRGNVHYHPEHHGRVFTAATQEAARDLADAYCLEHGLLQVYVRAQA